MLHWFEQLAGERIKHHGPRRVFMNPPSPEIEQCLFIKLTRCTTVRTFHVVGPDFQLRLGVNGSLIRQQNITVGLKRIGLLRIGSHKDLSVENAPCLIINDSLLHFVAECIRLTMIHNGMVVCKCVFAQQVKTIHVRIDSFAVKGELKVVSHRFAIECERKCIHAA